MDCIKRHPATTIGGYLALLALLLLVGCSRVPDTGPGEVRWDQEVCSRCVMAVSDRNYAAQVRGGPAESKTTLYQFDDIGCAVIWLDQQLWKDDSRTEIWVKDFRDGAWIDARTAYYLTDKHTPMDYGLGAQEEPAQRALDFAAAREHIYQVEKRFNIHRGEPHPRPPAQ